MLRNLMPITSFLMPKTYTFSKEVQKIMPWRKIDSANRSIIVRGIEKVDSLKIMVNNKIDNSIHILKIKSK